MLRTYVLRTTPQDRGYVWKGQKDEDNVFKDEGGKYEPDEPSTQEVKFKTQRPEENVFEDVKVCIMDLANRDSAKL